MKTISKIDNTSVEIITTTEQVEVVTLNNIQKQIDDLLIDIDNATIAYDNQIAYLQGRVDLLQSQNTQIRSLGVVELSNDEVEKRPK